MNGISLGHTAKVTAIPLHFGHEQENARLNQPFNGIAFQPPAVQHAIANLSAQEIGNINQPSLQLARSTGIRPGLFEPAQTRRGAQAESYAQPIINSRVNNLIREIQQVHPNFTYNRITSVGQPYNQSDIDALNQTIAPIRAELLVQLPDLNPTLASRMSLGDLDNQVHYKTYLANGGKASFMEWSTEKPLSPEKSALSSDRNQMSLEKTNRNVNWMSADDAYNDIRASHKDVDAIAKNTGIKHDNIQKVKDHIFFNTHLLDRYVQYGIPAEYARFDSDINIAEAWKRMEIGMHSPEDIQLIKHEIAERWVELQRQCGYCEAHDRASLRFPAPDWWR